MDKIQKELEEVRDKLADIERTQEWMKKAHQLEREQEEKKGLRPLHFKYEMM